MSKRYGTIEERFWANVVPEPMSGCWLWTGPVDDFGYGRFREEAPSKKKVRAHVLSCRFHGKLLPPGFVWRHTCDLPACVNPDHLIPGSDGDNVADMDARGRRALGERAPCVKLTESEVIEIFHAPGSQREIASRYGISHNNVGKIKRQKTWKVTTMKDGSPSRDLRPRQ